MISSYQDLIVWQKSFELATAIYLSSKKFPKEETYGITSQIRRAAYSIPSNIAEGYVRHRKKEYIHFLLISAGSAAELETQLLICKRISIISENEFNKIYPLLKEIIKMLNSLISKLEFSS